MAGKGELDRVFMTMAMATANLSKAERNKVGTVIVKDGQVISMGFNGTPSGFDNCCETPEHETKPEVLHAESNALMKMAHSTESCEGATLYTTLSPCFECAKLIIQARIERVVFLEWYRTDEGVRLLDKACVKTAKLKQNQSLDKVLNSCVTHVGLNPMSNLRP